MIEGLLNTISTENRPTQEVQRPKEKVQKSTEKIQRRDSEDTEKRKEEDVKATEDARKDKEKQVEQVIEDLASAAKILDRELRFEMEKELDITVVKVIDGETEEVIRQIPPEELVELSKRAKDLKGHLLDTEG